MSDHFLAEIFLAQDTGIKDAAGKDIVNVFGGLKAWLAGTPQLRRTGHYPQRTDPDLPP